MKGKRLPLLQENSIPPEGGGDKSPPCWEGLLDKVQSRGRYFNQRTKYTGMLKESASSKLV